MILLGIPIARGVAEVFMPSDGIGVASSVPWPPAHPSSVAPGSASSLHFWADGSFSFRDFLDTINPLQHLPVVSTIYGWITGKHDIGDLPRIAGDALYGGPWGALSGLVNALVKEESGQDIGEHVVATLIGDTSATAVTAASAEAQPPTSAPGAAAPQSNATPTAGVPSGAPAVAPNNPSGAAPLSGAAMPSAVTTTATATGTPSAPALPDHPPMPLFHNASPPVATTAAAQPPAATKADPTSKAFLAETAQRERQLYRSTGAPTDSGRVLNSQPVALMVPPGALPNGGRPRLMPASAVVPSTGATAAAPDPNTPVDISQKMLDALDKYAALQRQQNENGGRGSQVNVTP
jgi:hypothetical protein